MPSAQVMFIRCWYTASWQIRAKWCRFERETARRKVSRQLDLCESVRARSILCVCSFTAAQTCMLCTLVACRPGFRGNFGDEKFARHKEPKSREATVPRAGQTAFTAPTASTHAAHPARARRRHDARTSLRATRSTLARARRTAVQADSP